MTFDAFTEFCRSLPAVTEDVKWGADLCFCVGGKMFAVTSVEGGEAIRFSFKADEETFYFLTDREGFAPAPYLARAHWVAVTDSSALGDEEAQDLIRRAHSLIAAKLPKRIQKELGLA